MDNDMEMTRAEEFFGEIGEEGRRIPNGHARKSKKKAKTSAQNRFAKIKVKMVMRIYGVSKKHALEIIDGRAAEKRALESGNGNDGRASGKDEGGFMSAKDFFGEVDE